ncbi:MAG: sigma factor-like helix-turn-helix DNA-binding protein [Polyangiaceae bacterium]
MTLVEGYLRQRAARGIQEGVSRELASHLESLWRAGQTAHPDLPVSVQGFTGHLAAVVEDPAHLERLEGADLYLAVACLEGARGAAERLEASYGGDIDAVVSRQGLHARRDEIRQRLRRDLIVGGPSRPPFLTTYGGRGSLKSWLKVVALRAAIDLAREEQKLRRIEVRDDDVIFERAGAGHDAELMHLKEEYAPAVKRAFEAAFASLDRRDRQLLRFQYLDGLNLDQTAVLFQISRATAARHRSRASHRLLSATRRYLAQTLALSDRECDSVMKLVRSRLDLSMSRLLHVDTPS